MEGGVKLYKHFTEEISKMGRIKRAWFTTFNFDISFFEKYILAALTGIHYADIKTPLDYESISSQLANDNQFTVAQEIEVKVFCDFRAEQTTGRVKQTVVQVYKLDLNNLRGLNPNVKFDQGVFHPKVVLLESYRGEYWFMTGSANLTFGGWASNRESFFCEKITNTEVAREIGLFFSGITSNLKEFNSHPLLTKLNTGKFGTEPSKWTFLSSFSSSSLLSQLIKKTENKSLTVWSPYFSNDLPQILLELQAKGFDIIHIVPAKTASQKIRITAESFSACSTIKSVRFLQERLPASLMDIFVHAKVWITPNSIAIGSWNLTRSGMNTSVSNNNNIEAGVILRLSTKEYNEIIAGSLTGPLRNPLYATKEELDAEKEDLLDKFTIAVDLQIDWDKLEIHLLYPRYQQLIKNISPDHYITLPGIGKLKVARLSSTIDVINSYKTLLSDRFFEITRKDGKIMYRGFLREKGLASRPVNSFKNIDDLFKGWVTERPEDKTEWHRPLFNIEEEYGDDFSEQTRKILLSTDQNAWFTSFQAFESMVNRIQSTTQLPVKQRVVELKRIGRVLPGSLVELKNHLEELQKVYLTDPHSFKKSPIYLWFLIEKANQVILFYNNLMNLPSEQIKRIKNLKIVEMLSTADLNKIGVDKLEKWTNYVTTKLKV